MVTVGVKGLSVPELTDHNGHGISRLYIVVSRGVHTLHSCIPLYVSTMV